MRILVVTNMYPSDRQPHAGTFIEQQVKSLREAGLDADVLVAERSQKGYLTYFGLGANIRRRISRMGHDLVHVMYGGVMAKNVLKAAINRPAVVSFCGSDLLGENLPGFVRKMAVTYGVWCSHFAARHADGIVVKSKNLWNALPAIVEKEWVRIIPNGIDLRRFTPMDPRVSRQRLGWDENRFHVLFPTNSGTPRKRFWLAQAAVEVTKLMGVPVELHRLEGLKHEEVPLWLNGGHCLILTSEHEGSPNIVKEALACNRPVVSVDVGDVAERIMPIPGCYLSPAAPEALAECLRRVFAGPPAVNSRAHLANLSLEAVAEKLLHFYGQVLEKSQQAGRSSLSAGAR